MLFLWSVLDKHSQLKQRCGLFFDRLVCSDAMARGMDLDNVKYVISYDNPPYIKTYIHRVGRTARAGRAGTAVSLLEKKEVRVCRIVVGFKKIFFYRIILNSNNLIHVWHKL